MILLCKDGLTITLVVNLVNQYQKLQLQLCQLLMMGVNTRNMYSCLQKCNKLNKLHLVGQLLNSIHDAQTMYITFIKFPIQFNMNSVQEKPRNDFA